LSSLEIFSKNVRTLMAQRNVRLKDLAEKIGVSEPYLSLVLSGTRTNLSDEYKDRIAAFFNVSMAHLYSEEIPLTFSEDGTFLANPDRTELKAVIENFLTKTHLQDFRVPFYVALSTLGDNEARTLKRFFLEVLTEIEKVQSRIEENLEQELISLPKDERTLLCIYSLAGQNARLQWVEESSGLDSSEFSRITGTLEAKGLLSMTDDVNGQKRVLIKKDISGAASSLFTQNRLVSIYLSLAQAMELYPDDGPFFHLDLAKKLNRAGRAKKALSHLKAAASSLESQKLWQEAAGAWHQAALIQGSLGNQREKGRYLSEAARCMALSGDLETADELGIQSCSLFQDAGSRDMAGNACLLLGNLWAENNRQKAIQWYEDGLKVTPDSSLVYGKLLVNLASLCFDTGKLDRAENILRKAERWVEGRSGEEIRRLQSHMSLVMGLIQYQRRNWASARKLFLSCIEKCSNESEDNMGVALHNLGMLSYREDDTASAIHHLNQAMDIYSAKNFPVHWAYAAVELAKAHLREGNVETARELLRECSTKLGPKNLRETGWVHLLYSCIDAHSQDFKGALENGKRAVELFGRDTGSERDLACAALWLSGILEYQGHSQAAKSFQKRAFRIYERKHWDVRELHRECALLSPRQKSR